MNNIQIAKETIKITEAGRYIAGGHEVVFNDVDVKEVIVIDPKTGEDLLAEDLSSLDKDMMCRISVVNDDSFEASKGLNKPLVMNFANAHVPGGGFLHGAAAQEEALCRTSTLYASISSSKAAEMYRYNNTHISQVESDYMLISPNVVVFRGEGFVLLEKPYTVGVITAPAPNRYGAAMLAGAKTVDKTFERRIRIICAAAAKYGFKSMVLGAWGCGAFGNDPVKVSCIFKQVIIDEGYGRYFEDIKFAVYGREDGKNITAFRKIFNC